MDFIYLWQWWWIKIFICMSRGLYYFKPRDYLVNSYDYLMLYCKLFEILDGGWKLTCQLSSTLQGTTQDASNPFTVPVLIFYTHFMFALHSLWKVNIRPRHVIGRPLGRPTSQSDCSSLLDYSIETVSRSVFIIQYRIQSLQLTYSSLYTTTNYTHIFINCFYKLTILLYVINEICFNKKKV